MQDWRTKNSVSIYIAGLSLPTKPKIPFSDFRIRPSPTFQWSQVVRIMWQVQTICFSSISRTCDCQVWLIHWHCGYWKACIHSQSSSSNWKQTLELGTNASTKNEEQPTAIFPVFYRTAAITTLTYAYNVSYSCRWSLTHRIRHQYYPVQTCRR